MDEPYCNADEANLAGWSTYQPFFFSHFMPQADLFSYFKALGGPTESHDDLQRQFFNCQFQCNQFLPYTMIRVDIQTTYAKYNFCLLVIKLIRDEIF